MKISLIGMSNVGKTYWAKKFEKKGFKRFSCDDLIEKRLKDEFRKTGFFGSIDIAEWMGQPYEKQYPQTSGKYLAFEKDSLKEILAYLKKNLSSDENIVVDTTGSVIYTGEEILKELRELTTVLYFHTPDCLKREMYKSYLSNPKPVIWGNSFKSQNGEIPYETLSKSYPKLLDFRAEKYNRYADFTLNYFLLRSIDFDTDSFLCLLNEISSNGKVKGYDPLQKHQGR